MKFILDPPGNAQFIRAYGEGQVRVGPRTLTRSCIVAADRLIEDWSVTDVTQLGPGDFEPVFALEPEVVILGTGRVQRFPPAEVRWAFARRALALEVMDLGAACRTYNVLLQDQRRVVAALVIASGSGPPEEDTRRGSPFGQAIIRS